MTTRFHASTRVETTFPFACQCGFRGEGTVIGEGYAQSDSPLLFADPTAESRALDDAEGRAWADAVSSVELAPCPACGRRDGDKWRLWMRQRLLPGLSWGVLGGVLGLIGLFLLRQELDRWPLVAGGGAFLAVTVATIVVQTRQKRARSAAVVIRPVAPGA